MLKGSAVVSLGLLMDPVALRDKLLPLIEPLVREEGLELNDLVIGGGQRRPTVQVLVERPDGSGAGIDECARISRYLSPALDAEDVIPQAFVLEVSSPGVERALRTPRHFETVVGRKVKIVAEGAGYVAGLLKEVREGCVVVESSGTEHVIELDSIRRANLWVPPDELFGRGGGGKGKAR